MLVVAFATFIVIPDDSISGKTIKQTVFQRVLAAGNGSR
jgi:hypothetical protein